MRGFMKSSREMVAELGEIHVTHKTAHPFSAWKIVEIANEVGLHLVKECGFHLCFYNCYINKKGSGVHCDDTFRVGNCSTFIFMKKEEEKFRSLPLLFLNSFE